MDEFDKIRELSEGLSQRKEPTFTGFNQPKEPSFYELSTLKESVVAEPYHPQGQTASYGGGPSYEGSSLPSNEPNRLTEPFNRTPLNQKEEGAFQFADAPEEEISFEPLTSEASEKDLPNMRFHLIFVSLLLVVLILSLVGFFMFRMEGMDSDEIATITASQEAVKEMPEQAGGMNIPDQDKLVYNRIRSDSITTKVESLFPEPEKPVLPQILAIEQNAPVEDFVSMNEVEAVDPFKQAPVAPISSETKAAHNSTSAPLNATPQVEKPILPPVQKQEEVISQKPKKEVITLAPVTVSENILKVEKVIPPEGIWRVQLFASNNKDAVEKAWKRIEVKHNKLLSNMSYLIKKVEIKGKGDFYRLQVGQFPSREMADGLCTKLKAKKQDCIPTK